MDALSGDTAAARLEYIVRDHDREKFEARKELLRGVEKAMTEKYPTARVELALKDSYYNMLEQIRPCMHLIDNAKKRPARRRAYSGLRRRRAGVQTVRGCRIWVCPVRTWEPGAITSTGLTSVSQQKVWTRPWRSF